MYILCVVLQVELSWSTLTLTDMVNPNSSNHSQPNSTRLSIRCLGKAAYKKKPSRTRTYADIHKSIS